MSTGFARTPSSLFCIGLAGNRPVRISDTRTAQIRAQAWTTVSGANEVGRRQPAQRPTVPQRSIFLNHGHTAVKALAGVLNCCHVHAAQQTDAFTRFRQEFTPGLMWLIALNLGAWPSSVGGRDGGGTAVRQGVRRPLARGEVLASALRRPGSCQSVLHRPRGRDFALPAWARRRTRGPCTCGCLRGRRG
jgi:hypothetical protein